MTAARQEWEGLPARVDGILRAFAYRFGDAVAVADDTASAAPVGAALLLGVAEQVAQRIHSAGIEPYEEVNLDASECGVVHYAAAYFGIQLARAVPVLAAPQYRQPAQTCKHQRRFSIQVGEARSPTPALVIRALASASRLQESAPRSRAAHVLPTSGTTGRPTEVHHSHRFVLGSRVPRWPSRPRRWLYVAPATSFAGTVEFLVGALKRGHSSVRAAGDDPRSLGESIARWRPHRVSLPPASASHLVRHLHGSAVKLTSVRRVTVFGAPSTPRLLQDLATLFPRASILDVYGLTQGGSAQLSRSCRDALVGRGFRPNKGTRVFIGSDPPRDARRGGVVQGDDRGSLWLAGQQLRGWLNTGDTAARRGRTRVRLLGRSGESDIVGGHIVFLSSVESTLQGLDAVHDCRAEFVVHPVLGTRVAVDVVPADPSHDLSIVRQEARELLPKEAYPTTWRTVGRIERNQQGKLPRERGAAYGRFADHHSITGEGVAAIAERIGGFSVDPEGDLLDLGFDSLMLMELVSELEDVMRLEIDLELLYSEATPSAISAALYRILVEADAPPVGH